MELAQHVADGEPRFLIFRRRRQAELRHRIDDAPLHRFEAVADVRQRPVEDHVVGLVEIGLLGEDPERQSLDVVVAGCFNTLGCATLLALLCGCRRRPRQGRIIREGAATIVMAI